jgi:hypothetical protein
MIYQRTVERAIVADKKLGFAICSYVAILAIFINLRILPKVLPAEWSFLMLAGGYCLIVNVFPDKRGFSWASLLQRGVSLLAGGVGRSVAVKCVTHDPNPSRKVGQSLDV